MSGFGMGDAGAPAEGVGMGAVPNDAKHVSIKHWSWRDANLSA